MSMINNKPCCLNKKNLSIMALGSVHDESKIQSLKR